MFDDDEVWPGWGQVGSRKRPLCYKSHPALPLGEHVIHGGSCITPVIEDADVYIGLDRGMALTERRFPWTPGHEVLFPIADRGVPTQPKDFARLVEWTAGQLAAGRKIHVGCIGGHGRTGLFLTVLTLIVLQEKDAIGYVRKHYCRRAVESQAQIDFLVRHFSVKPARPTGRRPDSAIEASHRGVFEVASQGVGGADARKPAKRSTAQTFRPLRGAVSIWGEG